MVIAQAYAHALYTLTQDDHGRNEQSTFENFVALLKKKGHIKLLPNILTSFEALLNSKRDETTLVMTCARKKDFAKFRAEFKEHFTHQDTDTSFTEEIIDNSIIGGFIIKRGDIVVDASYKKKLLTLYQSATI